jgi:hypothetical protein
MAARRTARKKRTLDARPDTPDFRDRMYVPTLIEVPTTIDLDEYRGWQAPILDQGTEGACTGFGLAAVANYLLRKRKIVPDDIPVSPWMFYAMAKRYDEWAGEGYEGSSCRGAMKGWHKHGVCASELWGSKVKRLTDERVGDAGGRPLGAYYRVNHRDLVAMHSAISEVGILYASAQVHEGWSTPGSDGRIEQSDTMLGGHAFALVAFDDDGFWIQNSWGPDWGFEGFGKITYDDWLANGTDIWVARLGAPITLRTPAAVAATHSAAAGQQDGYTYPELRPHIISIGNDGRLRPEGTFGTGPEDVETIFLEDFPRITKDWKAKRILLYAHGGLVPDSTAVQRVADYRSALLEAEVYPISFVWRSDFWTTLTNILEDALSRRRPEGVLDAAKDFMLDRLDDALEPIARVLMGKAQWDEMKENALRATTTEQGGARIAARNLAQLLKDDPSIEVHLAGHSAGSIFHAPLAQLLASSGRIAGGPMARKSGLGLRVSTCTLWAPACTVELFKAAYMPAIKSGRIGRFAVFALTDKAEQDDNCGNIYHKSLLYLVSNAFEDEPRVPLFRGGEPILGMERFLSDRFDTADQETAELFKARKADLVLAPNDVRPGSRTASRATSHGAFDDDRTTVRSTLARVLDKREITGRGITFRRSASSLRDRRLELVR